MAGEIEEPLRFNFQADLLHSGSISFGRFESESLSWERRSSFSHNRYLEEVEKYSKPGSVTEKKAYFEAHFKRKALLKQSSSESQDGRELASSENDDLHDLQESENGNESKHFTYSDESPHSSGHFKYDKDTEIQISVDQNVETLCSENTDQSSVDHTITGPDHLNHEETHQTANANVDLVKSEEPTEVAPKDSVVTAGVASEKEQPKPKPKVRATRNIAGEASNVSAKTKTREIKGLTMKEKEKKSPRPASSIEKLPRPASAMAHSGRKTSKSKESSASFPKAKLPSHNKSIVKEHTSEKPLPGARRMTDRTKQVNHTPSKPHANPIATGFTFKSDQRAERRKEEKRAAAEMTQPRKSLNFKATPMPTFYKESTRSSDQNKAISASKMANRPRTATMASSARKAPVPSNSANSSNPRPSSSTSITSRNIISRNRPLEPSKRVQETKKDLSLPKQKVREAVTGPRVRDTKGVHSRIGLKPGYIAVGVAT